jgi:DNA-binding NarL/FixJ family response regulator
MKILVVDDDVLSRKALRNVLKELGADITVLEAADNREAMRLIEEHPDLGLIVLDLNLPERDGFSVLSELRVRHPAISVVVMSAEQDRHSVVKALDQGALGFIPKSAQRDVMLSALQLVFAGGVYIPPEFLFRKRRDDGDLPEAPAPAVPPTRSLGPQGEAVPIVPEEP